jgi:MoxR-like ATPase
MKNGNNLPKSNVDLDRIRQIGAAINSLCDQLNEIFPGRTGVIQQLKFALLTRHHVLMSGPYGTGKTDLVNTFFGQITDARKISFALTKFSTDSHVFGIPNTKIMNETGKLEFDTDDPLSIFKSHFVELDEFLDANAPVLRSLLGLLNERVWKRGRTFATCDLHTALASTNKDLEREVKNDPQLDAVIDRFLFQTEVHYLDSKESRLRMYGKYLRGETPSVEISYEDLCYISQVVLDANQFTDDIIIETYDDIIQDFSGVAGRTISDRRKCKLLQLIEANALLYGRFEVVPEDILAVKWGVCYGHDTAMQEKFENIAKPHIERANEAIGQNIDQLQLQNLDQCTANLDQLRNEQVTDDNFAHLRKRLHQIREDVALVKPQMDSTRMKQNQVFQAIDAYREDLEKFVTGGN